MIAFFAEIFNVLKEEIAILARKFPYRCLAGFEIRLSKLVEVNHE